MIAASLGAVAPHASLGLVGVPADPAASIQRGLMQAMIIGVRIYGIIEGDSVPDEFIPRMVVLHAEGRFPFDKMITKYPFAQINAAIEAQHADEVVKAVPVHE